MLDKFLFGNKHIPEMYFGNIPVAQIYFGNTLVWEKEGYVPYDDTCTATVTLSQDKMAWIVTITKNGEDVTSSLKQMITWIYNGKGERVQPQYAYSNTIDLSQHPRGDYRLDLSRITSKDNSYFPSAHAISFPEHIYIGNLLAGSQNVAIEYIPTQDISVTDIGIFTDENSTGRTPRIKIFHECGLCVAFANGDVQTTNQAIYYLNGSNHDAVIQAATLKAGQKYYIVYSHGYGSGNDFYPAYFQNTNGNYKVYENELDNIQVFDISENSQYLKPSKYKGVLTNSMGIFAFSSDDWFVWMGSTETGMTQGQVYRRTNVGEGWIFTGIIGDPNNTHTITAEDLQAIISKPSNADFIWYVDQVPNMTRGEIWGKPSTWVTPTLVDISTYNEEQFKLAFILKALNTNTEAMLIGSLFWNNKTGKTYKLNTGYISDVTSMTPLDSYPANPQDKHIYFLSKNAASHWEDAVWVYENSTYTKIVSDNMNTYFSYEELSTKLEKIGTNQQLLEALYNADTTFLNATVNTDKKFYLKLNGNEV